MGRQRKFLGKNEVDGASSSCSGFVSQGLTVSLRPLEGGEIMSWYPTFQMGHQGLLFGSLSSAHHALLYFCWTEC